ncbi:hypothetical protein SAMN04489727_5077 [Amycolatopsis tolypomycina]|uniref:Uncharacterized protein n=1 Tax=Amycolatopsis tolypomycina TaxID=208445 RepID=A0A1H4VDP5_9PSEU|nr:hypothetical protein [Amycolatopsis tolypomycina]SEC78504.1 hypothetical protein SAMN04489727_5077 [Amycolatopsis tolypomycina]
MWRFVKPALWTFGVLATAGLAFWLVLAMNIPYKSAAAPDTTPETTSASTTAPPPSGPTMDTAYVTDVRPGPDDRTVLLHVTLPTCVEVPETKVADGNDRVDVDVRFRRPGGGADCPPAPTDVPVRLRTPIGLRPVFVNTSDSWGQGPGGWRRCDRFLSCTPPADHCDPRWIGHLEARAEAEFSGTTRACDQHWLIHDLQRHSAEPPHRVVYRWAGDTWADFASPKGGGCGEILAAEPKFPTALCKDLAPPA